MNRIGIAAALVLAFLGPTAALPASAQTLEQQVVGTWTLQSGMEKRPDGKTVPYWAAGSLMLDGHGHVSLFLVGKDRPKADPDPRLPVGPFVSYYGSYSVDEATKVLTFKVENAASPAFTNSVRVQTVSLSGDTMTLTGNPVKTPGGDVVPVNEWKRAK